jgi:predicted helicase
MDENDFDITQGVAIVLFVKHGASKSGLHYAEFSGSRAEKYAKLGEVDKRIFNGLPTEEPYHFFLPKSFSQDAGVADSLLIDTLFQTRGIGIKTERDKVSIHHTKEDSELSVSRFLNGDLAEIRAKYGLKSDSRDWTVNGAINDIRKNETQGSYVVLNYRLFDRRHAFYTGTSRGYMGTPAKRITEHMLKPNMAILVNKKFVGDQFSHVSLSEGPFAHGVHYLGNRGQDYGFPLYLYPEEGTLDQSVQINFAPKHYAQIRKAAGLTGPFGVPDSAMVESGAFRTATGDARPDEVKVFDYIYGVLHCSAYRETYAEFLKIDFPRVPFPPSPAVFRTISEQGEALRRLHLMEEAAIGPAPYPFDGQPPEGQDSVVDKPRFESGRVYINGKGTEGQYFDTVPPVAWNFPIGGYQPAQKWLKDRKGRTLTWDDIRHYQRIIKILAETDRIMRGIEMHNVDIEAT